MLRGNEVNSEKVRKTLIMYICVLFLLLFPTLSFAQSFKNDLTAAIKLFKTRDYKKSASILKSLAKKDPDNALIWFNLGHNYFKLKKYSAAIKSYKKVVELKSKLSLPASLYAVKAYLKIGKLNTASNILKDLKTKRLLKNLRNEFELEVNKLKKISLKTGLNHYNNKNYKKAIYNFNYGLRLDDDAELLMIKGLALLKSYKPAKAKAVFRKIVSLDIKEDKRNYKANAQAFLKQIEQDKWKGILPYWLSVSFRGGYNNNVYRDGISEDLFDNAVMDLSFSAGYQFYSSGPFSLSLSYNFKWEEIIYQSSLRYIENSLSAILSYNSIISLALIPGINYSILDAGSFLVNPEISLIAQKSFGNNTVGLGYSYIRQIAANNIYDYLSGNIHSTSVFYEYFGRNFSLRPYFAFSKEATNDLVLETGTLPLANIAFGPGIKNRIYLLNTLYIDCGVAFLFKYYDNIALPDNIERDDKQFNFYTELTKTINAFGLFIRFDSAINRSTLSSASIDDKDYNQFIILGGMKLDIF